MRQIGIDAVASSQAATVALSLGLVAHNVKHRCDAVKMLVIAAHSQTDSDGYE